ncbi:DNA -binding domain-containing protein [Pleionea sp. CnH1-48]|uniref:DNA -binding domain-containing protein n=1 Tax=Pleionea sp. CnH1-48 TaxID=2954494 RepID=UPI002096F93B|nr:DUF2285 domain-containing protein [Pleionea sp. CnH1-48]MCO7226658.1 DUF2285 domain-containing protein [Pleionea sp. CnH1-48]
MMSLAESKATTAWEFLRRNEGYQKDWEDNGCAKRSIVSEFPFPVIQQTEEDLKAEQWGILAYKDPADTCVDHLFWDGERSGRCLHSYEGNSADNCEFDLTKVDGKISGILLINGKLCINIDNGFEFVQLLIHRPQSFDIQKPIGLSFPMSANATKSISLVNLANRVLLGKSTARSTYSSKYIEYLNYLKLYQEGKSHREIAHAFYDREQVDYEWTPDSRLRAKVRYCISKAKRLSNKNYHSIINL